MNTKPYGFVVMLLLTSVSMAFAQTPEQQRETLRGLTGVAVVVEPLSPEAEHDGLTQRQLQADVEQQLRAAGIRALTTEEWSTTPGGPYLYVNVAALKKRYGLYAYSIEVCVNQLVALMRDQNIQQFAETWETREVGTVGAEKLPTVRKSVAAHVDTFITAYLTVNLPENQGVTFKDTSGDLVLRRQSLY